MVAKRPWNLYLVMSSLSFLLAWALSACGDGAGTEPVPGTSVDPTPLILETASELTLADETAIYAAVIEALYARRGDSIGGVDAPVVYLGKRIAGSGSLESGDVAPPPRVLDEAIRRGIQAALPDFPARLVWVDGRSEAPFVEDLQPGADNGAIIGLSHIARRPDGAVMVAAELSFNCNCELGGGSYFVVESLENRWRVTGEEAVWEA
jgi:hypothetical protein